jgi:hypothetical protein
LRPLSNPLASDRWAAVGFGTAWEPQSTGARRGQTNLLGSIWLPGLHGLGFLQIATPTGQNYDQTLGQQLGWPYCSLDSFSQIRRDKAEVK